MIVSSITPKSTRFNGKRSLAKAKAASVQENTLPITATAHRMTEFRKKTPNGARSAVQPLT